jgi:hypothetical protein
MTVESCPIFCFNENYENCLEPCNLYSDVLIHTGSIEQFQWQNCIAVKKTDDKLKVITGSNHFLTWTSKDSIGGYDIRYNIFSKLKDNYYDIFNNTKPINYDFDDDKTYVYLLDAFSFSNSGHNLSECLDKANYIIQNGYKNVLIFRGFKEKHNYKFIEILLPDVNFIEIDLDTIYLVKNIVVIPDCFFTIWKHYDLIQTLKTKVCEKYEDLYSEFKNKKIILMKTNRNINVYERSIQFVCEDMLVDLEANGYINIIPEDCDPFKLIIYLMFAKTIIISNGAVLYTNKIFYNLSANIIWIGFKCPVNGCSDNIIAPSLKFIYVQSLILNKDEILPQIKELDI